MKFSPMWPAPNIATMPTKLAAPQCYIVAPLAKANPIPPSSLLTVARHKLQLKSLFPGGGGGAERGSKGHKLKGGGGILTGDNFAFAPPSLPIALSFKVELLNFCLFAACAVHASKPHFVLATWVRPGEFMGMDDFL